MRTLLCLTLMLSFVSTTPAKTIRVGETEIFKTITSALKKASDGDTILVFGGFYKEGNIII
ncbi:MAG: nitrous oxide reductase family maturation protein NosD, partial [Flavobacteriales bacterium]|nr:nitrous oxide reductase family maturation protein NosD [Flavobacteriales bacterium]